MSGGSHDYQFHCLENYIESMRKYDSELADLMDDVMRLCHDIEWYESGDYDLVELQSSIADFKDSWMVATPELQEKVKKSILKYCDEMDKYSNILRSELNG